MSETRANVLDNLPKPALIGIFIASVVGIFFVQGQLNTQRGQLSPTYIEPLQDAPPMLTLTTETLGGFRGLISSYLWLRSNEMQLEKNYPEQMQLAEWITQLQPTVPAGWVNRSWNMAYNISRNYPDRESRWSYVYDAVAMLRDEGIRYNPQEPLVYDQLAYIFQHKIGQNLDDHHRFYKFMWMQHMGNTLWADLNASHAAHGVPDFDALINPNPADTNLVDRVRRLRQEYKLDPREMKAVHQKYGLARDHEGKIVRDAEGKPKHCLDWRMAETHSLYWASLGLKRCSLSAGREEEIFKLEKKVYVSMMYTFRRGKLNMESGATIPPGEFFTGNLLISPNLESGGSVHKAYMDMIALAQESRQHHLTGGTSEMGHIHFLRRFIQWLYFYNRETEARHWLKVAIDTYPDKMRWFPGYNPNTKTYNLDEIVYDGMADDMQRGGAEETLALMDGVLTKHFFYLADGNEEMAANYFNLAKDVHNNYAEKYKKATGRMGIAPFEPMRIMRLRAFLIEKNKTITANLRKQLGQAEDWLPDPPSANPGPGPGPGP